MHDPILLIIICVLATGVIKSIVASSERRMQMRLQAQQGADEDTIRQVESMKRSLEALRNEVAALRDTATQFDLSIESSVTRLDQRVSRIETASARAPQDVTPQSQPLSGR